MVTAAPIGLDFDNTLVRHDPVFAEVGVAMGLLPVGFAGGKSATRAVVRGSPDGERHWRRLQAAVYGREIPRAQPFDGVLPFLDACRRAGRSVVVVSHKTRYAAADPGGVDLRAACMTWLESRGFFDPALSPLSPDHVHFADTRTEKVGIIRRLGCRIFVDDLEEVFLDPDYPREVAAVLFTGGADAPDGPWRRANDWWEVADAVFTA